MDMSEIFGDESIADIETPQVEYTALPEGWYKVEVAEISDATSKAGNPYIKMKLAVLDEPYTTRKLFVNFNIVHANPKVVQIAKQDLAAFCKACEKPNAQSTDELVGSVVEAFVKVRADKPTDNDVKRYRIPGGASAKPAPSAPAKKPSAPKAEAKKMPWEK